MRKFLLSIITSSISFLLFSQEAQIIDRIEATVGSEILLLSEIKELEQQYKNQRIPVDRCQIYEQSLINKLFLHVAKIDSVEVQDAELEGQLDQRLRYFVNQIGSVEALEEYYGKSIVEIKNELRPDLKHQLMVRNLEYKIHENISVTPEDVKTYFDKIPQDSLPLINAEVEVAHLAILPKVKPEEEQRVKETLKDYIEQVKKGEREFSTLAILYSEDPGSATKGGELGMVSKGMMVPEFDAVALSLRNNEISDVFKTDFGYHVIQMIERRGERYNARHILLKPKIDNEALVKAEQKLDSLKKVIESGKLSFEDAVKLYSDDKDTKLGGGVIINAQTGGATFSMNEIDPKVFVAIDNLEVGEVSDPVSYQTPQKEGLRLVKLLSRKEPHKANLTDDYQIIQNVATEQFKQEVTRKWITKRVKETYVDILDDYQSCSFEYNWLKED